MSYPNNQLWGLVGLAALDGGMIELTGTATCFGFLGFFASLFPRTWPFAMMVLLAVDISVRHGFTLPAITTQTDDSPMRGNGWI